MKRLFSTIVIAGAAILLSHVANVLATGSDSAAVALTGQISSQEERVMEGVLVGAKKAGSTITTTVVSDKDGRYRFPRTKLEPGQYSLRIRAVGYEMDDPGTINIDGRKTITVDLKLHKASDLAAQLSNAEWFASIPGTTQQKDALLDCTTCHTLERIVRSKHTADEFITVMARMSSYSPGSSPLFPQKRLPNPGAAENPERFRKQAEYLSSINLSSSSTWNYPLKTLLRLRGDSTQVIITEYSLPRRVSQPHDVVLDSAGTVWYGDFGQQFIGKLDPKTGNVKEYPVPVLKQGSPLGNLDLEFDDAGNLWVGLMLQGGVAKFDPRTEKFQTFRLPAEVNSNVAQVAMVMPARYNVDGKVWTNNVGIQGIHRLDLTSGMFDTFRPYKDMTGDGRTHTVYGIAADRQNNLYFLDFRDTSIGKVDAKTQRITLYPTPTPNSRPRRGHMDSNDRLWFAEYSGNKFAMFDTNTSKFEEWAMPTAWSAPYDVVPDKNGEIWGGGMANDRISKLNPKTDQFTEYQLPNETNVRRVFVDNSTNPVTFWVGSDHGATIVKLEPLPKSATD